MRSRPTVRSSCTVRAITARRSPRACWRARVCRASRCSSGGSPRGSRRSPRARAPLDRRDAPMSDVADRPLATTPAEIVAAAEALRPQLYAEQAATEERSYYSRELHEAFREAGFYRLLMPRRYGGLEFDLPTYYRVITSIARGCPSSGWMLALGSAHVLQLATSFSERAQDELLDGGNFIASASFGFQD